MKRIISAILILSVLLGTILCTTVTASAAGGTYGNLSWSFSNGTLTISGYGEMQETTFDKYPWESYQYSVKTLVIKEGVTYIAPYAFFCFDAYTVTIPTSVRYIGHRAFYDTNTSAAWKIGRHCCHGVSGTMAYLIVLGTIPPTAINGR